MGIKALIGWIDLDPAVRPPRNDGSRDVKILHDLTPLIAAEPDVLTPGGHA
jgi:hypothetical protein